MVSIFFIIDVLFLILGTSGIGISAFLYYRNRNVLIKYYLLAIVFWTLSQIVLLLFYYLNEIIHYNDPFVNLFLNDLSFIFIAPFAYYLLVLIHEVFSIKMDKSAKLITFLAMCFVILPSEILIEISLPEIVLHIVGIMKGVIIYGIFYYVAFDINKHIRIIVNEDIRKVFRFVFIMQMILLPLMIIESIFFFERIYPFGISITLLFYSGINVIWLFFVSKYLHLPEIKLIDDNEEYENFFSIYKISKREREVVKLLLKGFSYEDIAKQLFISYETVKTHVNNIYKKSSVKNKIELSNLAKKCEND